MADSALLHLEDAASRNGGQVVTVQMTVSKRKDPETGAQPKLDFNVAVPKSLSDAVKIEGEQEVFRRYINSLAIAVQAEKRKELETADEGEGRKKAPYLETLGL